MIEVQLPSGEIVEVETDDPQAAAQAARLHMQKQSGGVVSPPTTALPRPPLAAAGQQGGQVNFWEQGSPPPPAKEPTISDNLAFGTQMAGRGLANIAGAPVDLTTLGMNFMSWLGERAVNALPGVDGVQTPRITNPVGGSQSIKDTAAKGAEIVQFPMVDREQLPTRDKLLGNVIELGTEALAPGAMMNRAANTARMAGKPVNPMLKPYADAADNAASAPTRAGSVYEGAKPLATDLASGAGAGTALTGYEMLPEENQGPIGRAIATFLGGLGGASAARMATSPVEGSRAVKEFLSPDRDIPADPQSGYRPSQRVGDQARQMMQDQAVDPQRAAANIADETAALRASGVEPEKQPTAGLMSNDEGLIAAERRDRMSGPSALLPGDRRSGAQFAARDRQVQGEAADRVQSLSPGEHVDSRVAQRYAQDDIERQREMARAPVERRRGQVLDAEMAETELGGQTSARRELAGPSSEKLDKAVVDDTMRPMQAEQRKRYEAIDPDGEVQRDPKALRQAIADLKASVPSTVPADEVLPVNWLRTIETAAKGDAVSFKDLNETRPYLAKAIEQARANNDFAKADSLRTIKGFIDGEAERLAAEGGEAGLRAQDAVAFTREQMGPKFGQGEGGRLRHDINQDDRARSNTPPTETAGRFLKPGEGGKEVAADLQRILSESPSREQGTAAAREYVLSDLAKTVGGDGKISPARLRAWIQNRQGMFEVFPGFRKEAEGLLQDVMNKRNTRTQLQIDLEQATANLKRTERDIDNSALSLLVDAEPKRAVASVFQSKDPVKAMAEIAGKLKGDEPARTAWKKAISEHLDETVLKTNRAATADGQRNPSFAELETLFQKHQKTLEQVYGPAEMNQLRTAHRLMENMQRRDVRATVNSPTAENFVNLRPLEIVAKLWYGQLKGGGITRSVKLALPNMPGYNDRELAGLVIRRAWFDPDLAQHLLTKPAPGRATSLWNKRLNQMMAAQQAGQESGEEE